MISEKMKKLSEAIREADTIFIGAGSGLSTSAGYIYTGERFERHFSDFIIKYGFKDGYSASFFDFPTQEEFWAFWSRMIYYERYASVPKAKVFEDLLTLVKDKEYFILTTNADHIFQRTGFDKKRLFYTQGDFGLWQCKKPCHQKTYDNKEIVIKMFQEQRDMKVPKELIPHCPKCGGVMYPNLRGGSWFVQDEGWYAASNRYANFVKNHQTGKVVYLDLGTGYNTPTIIKFPFMQMAYANKDATYVSINYGEAEIPLSLKKRGIGINNDIGIILRELVEINEK